MTYGLIGRTLAHSVSPQIHKALWGGAYTCIPLEPSALDAFFAERDFCGINVTIPYKTTVIPYLDAVGETAVAIGSVNTIYKRADGSLFGDNTDFYGLCAMLSSRNISLDGKDVLILGGGGSSLTAQYAARSANAASVTVATRTPPQIQGQGNVRHILFTQIYMQAAKAQVILNATPVGMFPAADESPVDLSRFPRLEAVADFIYNPLRTRLLQQAQVLGIKCVGGFPMLVAQAAAAARIWGKDIPAEKERDVAQNQTRHIRNYIFIGMPGSGKTTLGRMAAEYLGRPFVDLDAEIEKRIDLSCAEIIRQKGEVAFRTLETAAVKECGAKSGLVIACGGGAVLREENRFALRANGCVIWVRRATERLARRGRPLSANDQDLAALERTRTPLYAVCADATLENNVPLPLARDALNRLLTALHNETDTP
jgi:shikimate dehydrogenase